MSVPLPDRASIAVRRAEAIDAQRLWEWANDADTRAQSFSRDVIPWDEHVEWLRARLDDPGTALFVAVNEHGDALGQVRFDRHTERVAEISVTIAPEWRGRGYASAVLREACRVYQLDAPCRIIAYIKPSNEVSQRAFARAGFRRAGTARVRGESVVEMVRDANVEP